MIRFRQDATSLLTMAVMIPCLCTVAVRAQTAPAIGYMFPSGGPAGQTIDVVLGGYDWTPDMEVFVHDQRIKLEIIEPIGPVIVPEPPYWFGKKSRRAPFPLAREVRARLTIPDSVPSGVVFWQAANANGATATGRFMVGREPEVVEDSTRFTSQQLPVLPVTVSGQIRKIEEVDQYQFIATKSGPVTCSLIARELNSPLNAAIEVYHSSGRKVSSAFDTAGNDTALTFEAQADESYTVKIFDVDFRGNRSFVYRLHFAECPRIVTSIPAAGQRGTTHSIEFIGYGIATGGAKLESVTREVTFPKTASADTFSYQLETPFGTSPAYSMLLSDFPESVETDEAHQSFSIPSAVTGVLKKKFEAHEYAISAKKGDVISIRAMAQQIGSPLDVALVVSDASGKELIRNDDASNSTDAALHFSVPADGKYLVRVVDFSGRTGPEAVYRLQMNPVQLGFDLTIPELINAPIGEKTQLTIKVVRTPGFQEPIAISLKGLMPGVSVPDGIEIPVGKSAVSIELDVSTDAAATSNLVSVLGQANANDQGEMLQVSKPILIATTIKPPFSIDAEGKDDVTKWPRGTTFPAPVLIERDGGFKEVIRLEMAAKQGRHRQGIYGPELDVPSGTERILYPVFLPEWLETTRTSRMVVNGVAKVRDPKGNIRYSLTRQKTRMGFLPTGALLKLSTEAQEFHVTANEPFTIPLTIRRSQFLTEPAMIELVSNDTILTAGSVMISSEEEQIEFPIQVNAEVGPSGECELKIRATVMQSGRYPVISETKVFAIFRP